MGKRKWKSRMSLWAVQQKYTTPAVPLVIALCNGAYFVYLTVLLFINRSIGFVRPDEPQNYYSEVYNFSSYFSFSGNKDYLHPDSTTRYIFPPWVMLAASVVLVMVLLGISSRKVSTKIFGERPFPLGSLPIERKDLFAVQWVNNTVWIAVAWVAHLITIVCFFGLYKLLCPQNMWYTNELYVFFSSTAYAYILYPVINPVSIVTMLVCIISLACLVTLVSNFMRYTVQIGIFLSCFYFAASTGWPIFSFSYFSATLFVIFAGVVLTLVSMLLFRKWRQEKASPDEEAAS